jgi:salicylate hydroxylase
VLGNLFSRLSNRSQIVFLLHAYQCLRLPRTSETQASSRLNQHIFHLEDGEQQQERDRSMSEAWKNSGQCGGSANQWADQAKSLMQFGYDADEEVEKWWKEGGEESICMLRGNCVIG